MKRRDGGKGGAEEVRKGKERRRKEEGRGSKRTLALSRTTQLVRITKHIVQSDFRYTRKFIIANFTIDNGTPTSVQSTNHST